jgi:hypothetical protein
MKKQNGASRIAQQTIEDFGEQWTTFSDTSGYFGSKELLADFIQPFDIAKFRDARVVASAPEPGVTSPEYYRPAPGR